MIEFEYPSFFLLLLPWLAFLFYIYTNQKKAIDWISKKISPRFQNQFTLYTPKTLLVHLAFLFLMGLLLITASTGPIIPKIVEVDKVQGNIMLVIDGSSSMLAGDTTIHPKTKKKPYDRLEQAQWFSNDLIDALQDYAFGVMSFSGSPVVHSIPSSDLIGIKTTVQTLKVHSFQSPGSSLKSVLKELIRIASKIEGNFQVVLIGDGEQPENTGEDLKEELKILKEAGIVVHTVGVGSAKGGSVYFYISFTEDEKVTDNKLKTKDDSTGKKAKEVRQKTIKTVTTKRNDKTLEKIADSTNGKYIILEYSSWINNLISYIKNAKTKGSRKEKMQGKKSLSNLMYAFFLILFLLEIFYWNWISSNRKFILSFWNKIKKSNVSSTTLLILLLFLYNCDLLKAHDYNNQGIQKSKDTQFDSAKLLFDKSISFSFREQIPIYNQGNNALSQKDYRNAHNFYEKALEASPDFTEAIFNDSVALYLWGYDELSEEKCDYKKAIVLWRQAISRLNEIDSVFIGSKLVPKVKKNKKHISLQLEILEKQEKEYCKNRKEDPKKKQDNQKDNKSSQDDKSSNNDDKSQDDQSSKDGDKSKDGKDPKDGDKSKDGKDPKDGDKSKDGKDPKDGDKSKDGKDPKDGDKSKDGKDPKDGDKSKDGKDPKDGDKSKDGKDPKDGDKSKDGKDPKDGDKSKDGKDSKDGDKSKDGKDSKDGDKSKDGKDPKDGDKSKDGKDPKDGDKSKDGKDPKDGDKSKDGKDPKDGDKSKDGKEKDSQKNNDSKDGGNKSGDGGLDNGTNDLSNNGIRDSIKEFREKEYSPKKELSDSETKNLEQEINKIKERARTKPHRRSRHQQYNPNMTLEEKEEMLRKHIW